MQQKKNKSQRQKLKECGGSGVGGGVSGNGCQLACLLGPGPGLPVSVRTCTTIRKKRREGFSFF